MASDSRPSEEVEGSWSPRRPRTAAEQRAQASAPGGSSGAAGSSGTGSSGSTDPDVLAREIERTREELAETLDAIADKVSPKRVVHRTEEAVKEKASETAETVKVKAVEATEALKLKATEVTGTVKEKASEVTGTVKEKVALASGSVKDVAATVKDRTAGHGAQDVDGSVRVGELTASGLPLGAAPTTGSLADAADAGAVGLEPAGSEVPPLVAVLQRARTSSRTPALAGAGAAVLVVLLILRRRRS